MLFAQRVAILLLINTNNTVYSDKIDQKCKKGTHGKNFAKFNFLSNFPKKHTIFALNLK